MAETNPPKRHSIFVRVAAAVAVVAVAGLTVSRRADVEDRGRDDRPPAARSLQSISQFTDPRTTTPRFPTQEGSVPKLPPFSFIGPYDDRRIRAVRIARYDGCMRFMCAKATSAHCQDHKAETVYDHPTNPPCCTHVLRDMIRVTDEALGSLNLEYFAAYGTLLGLVRNDHVIPWTADNDFVMSFAVHEELIRNRDYLRERFGLHLCKDTYLRCCVADNFMGGQLARWRTNRYDKLVARRGNYIDVFPYSDFFIGDLEPKSGQFIDERGCGYDVPVFRPMNRISVYNNTFQVNVPNDFLAVLEHEYGKNWRTPDQGRGHGNTKCGLKKFFRKGENDTAWFNMWNNILGRGE